MRSSSVGGLVLQVLFAALAGGAADEGKWLDLSGDKEMAA
jgi:hypothetical protein